LVFLTVLAIWWPALSTSFSLDDLGFLLKASEIEGEWEGIRRLLSVQLFFETGWTLFGNNPLPWHILLLVFHAINASLLAVLALRWGLSRKAAAYSSLIFLSSQVAFTPIHWVSGFQELSMSFFALLAGLALIPRLRYSLPLAFLFALASLLCKESALLLLPMLGFLFPLSQRDRVILILGGLLLGTTLLFLSGSLNPRPPGDPYETALGLNLLWNFLGYLAWLVSFLDPFPDRLPEMQPGLALRGFLPLLLAGILAWRFRGIRRPLFTGLLAFLLLLLPILPLLRHSYLYYLYLPVLPLCLLAGAGLDLRGDTWTRLAIPLLLAFLFLGAWQSSERRTMILERDLLADPVIRYAGLLDNALHSLDSSGEAIRGDLRIIAPFLSEAVSLGSASRNSSAAVARVRFLPLQKALLEGKALRLFYPELRSAAFLHNLEEEDDWTSCNFWWTHGPGFLDYLGEGEAGRRNLAALYARHGEYQKAEREMKAVFHQLERMSGGDRGDAAAVPEELRGN
jgi:hypothetical protein